MEVPTELSAARDDVLRQVGRNVLLFQQIERLLKHVLNRGQFAGSVAKLEQLSRDLESSPDKRTLGQLVEPLLSEHLSPADDNLVASNDATEPSIAFRVSCPMSDEKRADMQRQLEEFVLCRNDLIHHSLSWIEFGTVEECRDTCRRLDEGNKKCLPIYQLLSAMHKGMNDAVETLRNLPPSVFLPRQNESGADSVPRT